MKILTVRNTWNKCHSVDKYMDWNPYPWFGRHLLSEELGGAAAGRVFPTLFWISDQWRKLWKHHFHPNRASESCGHAVAVTVIKMSSLTSSATILNSGRAVAAIAGYPRGATHCYGIYF